MQDPNERKMLSASIVRNQDLTNSDRKGQEVGTALIMSQEEYVYIKLMEQEFQQTINKNLSNDTPVLVPIHDPEIAPIVKGLWEKVQKIKPDFRLNGCVNMMHNERGTTAELLAYPFNVEQLKFMLEAKRFLDKAIKNPDKPAYSLAPKKSSPEVPSYKPVKRVDPELAQRIYKLFDPLLALMPEDEILLASDVEKRKRESQKGWNAYASEDPNVVLALVIFKNIFWCDLLIKGLIGNPLFEAKRYFSDQRPAVLVAMKVTDLEHKKRKIKDVISKSIDKMKLELHANGVTQQPLNKPNDKAIRRP